MSTWNGSPQRELTTNPLSGKFGADQEGNRGTTLVASAAGSHPENQIFGQATPEPPTTIRRPDAPAWGNWLPIVYVRRDGPWQSLVSVLRRLRRGHSTI
jgi:hypothetical protein